MHLTLRKSVAKNACKWNINELTLVDFYFVVKEQSKGQVFCPLSLPDNWQ